MGLEVATLAMIATASTAVSTATSYVQGRKSQAQQKEAGKIGLAQQQSEANRQRRAVSRSARIRRSQILQSSSNSGTSGSSAETNALSSLSQGVASNNSYLKGSEVAASAITSKTQGAAESAFRSQVASSIAGISSNVAFNKDAQKGIKSVFG